MDEEYTLAADVGLNGFCVNQFDPFFDLPALMCMTPQATLHVRRVYVSGLPPSANEQTIAKFFNQAMAAVGGNNTACPGDAVVNVQMNHERLFAFVEMRMVEEASNAMALDGILFEGVPLKIKRPVDYNPARAACMGPSQPNPKLNLAAVGLTPASNGLSDAPDSIFVGGLPYDFTEAQVRDLLEPTGPLRELDLVKDRQTGTSKSYAFCVYQNPAVTDYACAALNSMRVGNKTLTVRRGNQMRELETRRDSQPEVETTILLQAQQNMQLQQLLYPIGAIPSKVLCLVHAVTADALKDDKAYEDTMEDMRLEACKYGDLVKVVIPRPEPSGYPISGVGKVFLAYADIYGATKAKIVFHARKFHLHAKPVVAIYYPELKFANLELD
ncbi:hypothetical protein U9M48_000643 [Paspalum notatum var. saurae]|uniref:Splicing factor U2af large subunit n=1 Tax=Paspalum notatum var. saurae TaxID=547442 RepID=A0AAQ3PH89_PASNO